MEGFWGKEGVGVGVSRGGGGVSEGGKAYDQLLIIKELKPYRSARTVG